MHHAYSKHAEVTVTSLDDWEKQWKKNPQGIVKPAVVQVDFQEQEGGDAADNVGVAGGQGARLAPGSSWFDFQHRALAIIKV